MVFHSWEGTLIEDVLEKRTEAQEATGGRRNCIMRNFIIVMAYQVLLER